MGLVSKGKRDTNSIGSISESAIVTRFLQLGYEVLTPYGRDQRYDLVVENADEQFSRIQCKTGKVEDNGTVMVFNTASHNVATKKQANATLSRTM
ncbi:MAG: group I intron-associated PD-(D/E)XK endonuclease [Ktedonobacteraceae bacterium]|nr:group I intron-associated PD-(D/E)XK endonuclease [Chloroflexota bacterium]